MLRTMFLLFLLLPLITQAEIYKTTDSLGNPSFSDTPSSTAQKVELLPSQLYSPPRPEDLPSLQTNQSNEMQAA